ncbi:MAG: lytic polysaccharide monooxygenase [Actinomycetota bacterium]
MGQEPDVHDRSQETPVTMRPFRRTALGGTVAAGLVALLLAIAAGPADAHGAATQPGSRTYLCRVDGTHSTGDIQPNNPACAEAIAIGGKQPLWDWFGVLRGDGAGRTRGYIPDGQLCSGGEPKYAGYDLARADWPYTSLTAGAEMTIRYNAWAPHPGEFRLYVTKDGFDPTSPLGWDDLEDEPFSVWNQSQPNGSDNANGSPDYQWQVQLPNKTGQHIIYSIWTRSDSNETFYGCSDVRFDGGSGEVKGVGPSGATLITAPPASTPPTTAAPAPETAAAPDSSTNAPAAAETAQAPTGGGSAGTGDEPQALAGPAGDDGAAPAVPGSSVVANPVAVVSDNSAFSAQIPDGAQGPDGAAKITPVITVENGTSPLMVFASALAGVIVGVAVAGGAAVLLIRRAPQLLG